MNKNKKAFTLAEVLITLAIIGVVAALTIPALLKDYQQKVETEQTRMVKYKLTQATSVMNTEGLIGPYETTEDFVKVLQKHLKIIKTCDNDNLKACWPSDTIDVLSSDGKFVSKNVEDLKTGTDLLSLGLGTKNTKTMGIITNDGTAMIMTYSPKCTPLDRYTNYNYSFSDNKPITNATTNCISAIFDINGTKGPNKIGRDVRTLNSMFGSQRLTNTPISKDECLKLKSKGLVKYCEVDNDYWAGAVKTCNDLGLHLPSTQTLTNVMSSIIGITNVEPYSVYVYKNTWGMNSCTDVLKGMGYSIDDKKIVCLNGTFGINGSESPFSRNNINGDIWSNEEISPTQAYQVEFPGSPDIIYPEYDNKQNSGKVLCTAE